MSSPHSDSEDELLTCQRDEYAHWVAEQQAWMAKQEEEAKVWRAVRAAEKARLAVETKAREEEEKRKKQQ